MSHSFSWPCAPKRDLSELVCLMLWGVEEVTELTYVPKVKGLFSVSGSSRTFCQSEWTREDVVHKYNGILLGREKE